MNHKLASKQLNKDDKQASLKTQRHNGMLKSN